MSIRDRSLPIRTLTSTLEAAQKTLVYEPLWKIVLTRTGQTTYTYDRTRILAITQTETPEGTTVEVTLSNFDKTLTDLNFEHYQAVISYGCKTSAGDEYSATAPLRVRAQEVISGRSILKCILRPIGILDQLGEDEAKAIYTQLSTDTQTVKTLISAICAATLAPYVGYTAITVTYDSEDSLIDTFIPAEYFSIQINQSRRDSIEELLAYTGCKMRAEDDGELHIFVPVTSGTEWASPTGYVDGASAWTNEATAYDEDTATGTYDVLLRDTWGDYLELTHSAIWCDSVRIWARISTGDTFLIDIDIYYGGVWNDLYSGTLTASQWVTYAFGTKYVVTSMRIRMKYSNGSPVGQQCIYEADFHLADYYEYEFDVAGEHTFLSKSVRNRFINPNKEIVASHPDHSPSYTGNYTSATSYGLDAKTHTTYKRLVSDAQATAIATAKIQSSELDAERSFAVVPMNVGQELWDYVKITDSRSGDSVTGNIQYIQRKVAIHLTNQPLTFSMQIALGKPSLAGMIAGMLASGEEASAVSGRLSNENLLTMIQDITEYLKANAEKTVWVEESAVKNLDDVNDGANYKRLLATQVSAGKIYLSDASTYKVGYDPNTKRRVFVATPTTPYDIGDLWQDATTVKRCTTARASGAYVAGDWTATTLSAIADDATNSKLLTTDVTAGHIKLTSYTDVSGKWYDTGGVLIEADSGIAIYGAYNSFITGLLISDISAFANAGGGEVTVTCENVHGLTTGDIVRIAGTTNYNGKFTVTVVNTTQFKITDTWVVNDAVGKVISIETYIGTDGKMYAGGGNVVIDELGITIKDQNLILKYGGNIVGYLYGYQAGGVILLGNTDVLIGTTANGGVNIQAGTINTTITDDTLKLGADDDVLINATDELDMVGDYVNIRTGNNPGASNSGDIFLDSEDDIQLYADVDIIIRPARVNGAGRSKIEFLDTTPYDYTGARAIDTTYPNSSAVPILVIISLDTTAGLAYLNIHPTANPPTILVSNIALINGILIAVVPVGWNYRVVTVGTVIINLWHEVRIGA